jgi:hypothetical protein
MTYRTMIVDLERRRVVDLLPDRSAASTAKWLEGHPEIEVVGRDRAGLYADGARQGAPQARQVADRFHLLQNFREAIERQLNHLGPPSQENKFPRRAWPGGAREISRRWRAWAFRGGGASTFCAARPPRVPPSPVRSDQSPL